MANHLDYNRVSVNASLYRGNHLEHGGMKHQSHLTMVKHWAGTCSGNKFPTQLYLDYWVPDSLCLFLQLDLKHNFFKYTSFKTKTNLLAYHYCSHYHHLLAVQSDHFPVHCGSHISGQFFEHLIRV